MFWLFVVNGNNSFFEETVLVFFKKNINVSYNPIFMHYTLEINPNMKVWSDAQMGLGISFVV